MKEERNRGSSAKIDKATFYSVNSLLEPRKAIKNIAIQDVTEMANVLPRLPKNSSYIDLQTENKKRMNLQLDHR